MRVEQSSPNTVQKSETSSAKQTNRAAAPQESKRSEKAPSTSGDKNVQGAKAEISSKSKEFAQARAVASNAPDVREDKVAELKQRIADGNYKVDGASVADRLVDDHLRMSGIG
jgi:negative regulator of flagellin synthesis FlgM